MFRLQTLIKLLISPFTRCVVLLIILLLPPFFLLSSNSCKKAPAVKGSLVQGSLQPWHCHHQSLLKLSRSFADPAFKGSLNKNIWENCITWLCGVVFYNPINSDEAGGPLLTNERLHCHADGEYTGPYHLHPSKVRISFLTCDLVFKLSDEET